MSIGAVPGGTFDFLSEVQNFMIRFIIETIMPIYRKEQVNGFTMRYAQGGQWICQ